MRKGYVPSYPVLTTAPAVDTGWLRGPFELTNGDVCVVKSDGSVYCIAQGFPAGSVEAGVAANQALAAVYDNLQAETPPTGRTDDYDPTVVDTVPGFLLTTTANTNFTGIVAPAASGVWVVSVTGTSRVRLLHEDTRSLAANRFDLPLGANLNINPGESVSLYYSTVTSRWSVVA